MHLRTKWNTTVANNSAVAEKPRVVSVQVQVLVLVLNLSSPTSLRFGFGTFFGLDSVHVRGVRVYPYPRVYPTRPVPVGTGRVRVDVLRVGSGTGTTSTGTGIPGFTRKKPDFFTILELRLLFISMHSIHTQTT